MRPLEFLNQFPLAGVMLVVALGYLMGRLSVRGVTLGAPGFTLALALIAGHWGLDYRSLYKSMASPITLGSFGVALFIYSIGYEAGPRFFSSLRSQNGWKYISVGVVVTVTGTLLALGLAPVLNLDAPMCAGALAAALTAAPTYATASSAMATGALTYSPIMAVVFALCYPIGFIGQGLIIQLGPRVLRQNLSRGAAVDLEAVDKSGRTIMLKKRGKADLFTRSYVVTQPEIIGKPLRELRLSEKTGVVLSFVVKGDEVIVPDGNTVLEQSQFVMASGTVEELNKFERMVGEEVYRREHFDKLPPARRVVVLNSAAIGMPLARLNLVREHKCLITKIERAEEIIDPTGNVALQRDDIIEIVGAPDDVRAVTPKIGRFERASFETDIAVFAGGMFAGLLLGGLKIGGWTLGNAAGLLIAGIVIGRFQQFGPFSAHVPRAARALMRDLGLLLYLAETGIRAGPALSKGMGETLAPAMLATVLIMLGAAASGVIVATGIFRLRPVEIWGSLSGGMTSTALPIVKRMADSNEPSISFAAAFAGASLLLPFAGQIVVAVLR